MSECYVWRDGARFRIPAQVAGEELSRIGNDNGGVLTPSAVVDAAVEPESPLHPCFTWDTAKAARLYQEEEARRLIRSVYLMGSSNGDTPSEPTLIWIHGTDEEYGKGYRTSAHVMGDKELRQQALDEALQLLRGIQKRFGHLQELAAVFQAINAIPEVGEPSANGTGKPQKRKTKKVATNGRKEAG